MADWHPIGILAGFNGSCEPLERCARCGALVYRGDRELHDSWHAAQPAPLAERVRSFATRDRTRG